MSCTSLHADDVLLRSPLLGSVIQSARHYLPAFAGRLARERRFAEPILRSVATLCAAVRCVADLLLPDLSVTLTAGCSSVRELSADRPIDMKHIRKKSLLGSCGYDPLLVIVVCKRFR